MNRDILKVKPIIIIRQIQNERIYLPSFAELESSKAVLNRLVGAFAVDDFSASLSIVGAFPVADLPNFVTSSLNDTDWTLICVLAEREPPPVTFCSFNSFTMSRAVFLTDLNLFL